MAKKKLNKKVAMIGSAVLILAGIAVIAVFLHLSRDPKKFMEDGDTEVNAAKLATDQQQRDEHYKEAERNYRRAYGHAKTDELKVTVLYRLADIYLATDKWRETLGCWTQIVRLDTKNLPARFNRLQYLYIVAQNSPGMVWQEVASQASEFIDIVEKAGADAELAKMETTKLENDALKQKSESSHRLGPYLHLVRGRANLEIARLGMVTNRDDTIKQVVADLDIVKQQEPANADVYLYLAEAAVMRGELGASRGTLDARENERDGAIKLLQEGVEATKGNVEAIINLLGMKHSFAAIGSDPNQQTQTLASRRSIQHSPPSSVRMQWHLRRSPAFILIFASALFISTRQSRQ